MLISIKGDHADSEGRRCKQPDARQTVVSSITRLVLIAASISSTQVTAQVTAQGTDQGSSLPQAPQAPTVESINESDASARAASRFQLPEVGGTLELELRQNEGQDAPGILRRDTGLAEVELTLDIKQELVFSASLEARLALSTLRNSEERLDNDDEVEGFDLERLFLQLRPSDSLRLRLGRQTLRDPMETIIDEELDGLQVRFEVGRFEADVSLTREDLFEASSVGRQDDITNTFGRLRFRPNKRSQWTPYVLHRSAQSFDGSIPFESTWVGLQGIVNPDQSNVRYWLHGMAQFGEIDAGPEIGDESEDLGGFAVDAGINYSFGGRFFDSTLTLAAAYATGGSRDDRFRQSGLQSNDFDLNDKSTFRYFGEVLDPELTNIQILTLGWGVEPFNRWSADIALHAYQQEEAEDSLRGADIEFQPLGMSRDLGTGADIIIAYEPNKALVIQGTAGRFFPGDAFDNEQDDAWLAKLEIEYEF